MPQKGSPKGNNSIDVCLRKASRAVVSRAYKARAAGAEVGQFLAHSTGQGLHMETRLAISEPRMSKLGPLADRFRCRIWQQNSRLGRGLERGMKRDVKRKMTGG